MISVCMGLYNGEKYIREQLYSILNQTLQPDEVILCDDGSGDRTVEIVNSFIREHQPGAGWRLVQNRKNLGYPANFYHAMSICSGDIVFLADQDDIWDSRKLQRMCEVFREHQEAKAVCCKFGLVDAGGGNIHTIMTPARSRKTGSVRKVGIGDVFYKCEWPGMVLAYRRKWFIDRWKNREKLSIPHDFLICAWAAEEDSFLQLDEELAYHRRHESNTGGEEHRLGALLNRERKLKEISNYNNILDAFRETGVLNTQQGRMALERKQSSMKQRYDALYSGNVGKVIKNVWENRKDTRIMTAVCDVWIALGKGN